MNLKKENAALREKLTEALQSLGEPERIECKVDEILRIFKLFRAKGECHCLTPGFQTIRICNYCGKERRYKYLNLSTTRLKLRELRLSKGLTIKDTAEKLNMYPQQLSGYETGGKNLRHDKVVKLMNYLEFENKY